MTPLSTLKTMLLEAPLRHGCIHPDAEFRHLFGSSCCQHEVSPIWLGSLRTRHERDDGTRPLFVATRSLVATRRCSRGLSWLEQQGSPSTIVQSSRRRSLPRNAAVQWHPRARARMVGDAATPLLGAQRKLLELGASLEQRLCHIGEHGC